MAPPITGNGCTPTSAGLFFCTDAGTLTLMEFYNAIIDVIELVFDLIGLAVDIVQPLIDLIGAALVPALAIFAIYYARMQARTARNRLKLDTFDKRFVVFEAARTFLGKIATHARVKEEDVRQFSRDTLDAGFLLNVEVENYLNVIRRCALQAMAHNAELEELASGPERSAKVRLHGEEINWLMEQPVVLKEKFRPFLELPKPN